MTLLGKAFVDVHAQTAAFEGEVVKSAKSSATKAAALFGSILGVAAITKIATAGLEEIKEAQAVQAQTAAAIKSTGGAANVTAGQIESLASEQLKLTGVDDELIQKGANLLLTFTNVRNEAGKGNDIFNQATKAALDLSQAGFGSVESASVLLGKALNDPIKGVTALQRVGVALTKGQKDQVRALVENNDTLGAQAIILQEVNRQVGGSAEAFGDTLPGKIKIAEESIANAKGALVGGLAPALTIGAEATTFLTEKFAEQPEVLQQVEGGLLLVGGAVASLARPVNEVIELVGRFRKGQEATVAVTEATAAAQASQATTQTAVGATAVVMAEGEVVATTATRTLLTTLGPFVLIAGAVAGAMALMGSEASSAGEDVAGLAAKTDEELVKAFLESQRVLEEFGESVDFTPLIEGGEQGLGVLQRLREELEASGRSTEDVDAAIEENLALTEQKAANDDAAARSTANLTLETQNAVQALKDQADALRAQLDPFFGVIDASNQAADAQKESQTAAEELLFATVNLNNVQKKHKAGSKEVKDAELALAQAQRGVTDAQFAAVKSAAGLNGALLTLQTSVRNGDTSVEDATATLNEWVAQGIITEGQASQTSAQFQFLGAQAGNLDKSKVDIPVTTPGLAPAVGAFDALARKINALPGKVRISVGGGGGATLAAGGMVATRAHYAQSGLFVPKGTDTVPAMLTPGEGVLSRRGMSALGQAALNALNRGQSPTGGGAPVIVFAAGSVVVNAGAGTTPGEARVLGASVVDGMATRLRERRISTLARTG